MIDILYLANEEYPFTELVSMLKSEEISFRLMPSLTYSTKKLKIMYQHADNAINILLNGLQDLGKLISIKKMNLLDDHIDSLGFFISGISNLTEALHILRSDADYVLKKRGELHY